ncbi:MAG: hypothetical protein ABIR73_08955 [Usitatibacter sp.]
MAHADERKRFRGAAYIVARVRTLHATRPFMDLQSVSLIALENAAGKAGGLLKT